LFQGPRAQIDRKLYKQHMQKCLQEYPNLTIETGSVHDILVKTGPDVLSEETGATVYGHAMGVKLGEFRDGRRSVWRMCRPLLPLPCCIFIESGEIINAPKVVITTGTFLQGEIHIGMCS
jgi:tRNA uridine 5-carboxymethylaminomethyl modification enzyme